MTSRCTYTKIVHNAVMESSARCASAYIVEIQKTKGDHREFHEQLVKECVDHMKECVGHLKNFVNKRWLLFVKEWVMKDDQNDICILHQTRVRALLDLVALSEY